MGHQGSLGQGSLGPGSGPPTLAQEGARRVLTLSMPRASSNSSANVSPAAILMFTSSEDRRLGSLWKCLENRQSSHCEHKRCPR